ncbi:MAG: hypothetical protein A2556_01770 [Candidatus Vogelbacteria bacterium RIFOXYD2_FULL_44_9]|uniref:Uncharacterized protein n=1 Tax=Candidatus Vogelbacteria bacterium RIFOXYD2_FULL_44_9 TaxID=1802441 RepID=A0A1G2QRD6_9BACT|nr:MAG: hypothetical protein A2556_01770 [Candidatus Vogelbacteria bacterium RIFOXYD2_FULL_44_9]
MTKKIIWLVLILAILAGGVWWYQKKNPPSWQDQSTLSQNSSALEELVNDSARLDKLIKNSQVTVDIFSNDKGPSANPATIALKDGVGEFVMDSKTNLTGDVFLVAVIGKNKVADGYDIFADLAFNSGGTGIFHNVAIFHLTTSTATYVSSGSLGDRIKVLSATALLTSDNSYDLIVKYLDRRDEEPMSADPTVTKTAKFQVIDHLIKS